MPHGNGAYRPHKDQAGPWTKTWKSLNLRVGEPYRLTTSVYGLTAGSCATITKWTRVSPLALRTLVRDHVEPQLLRVGDLCVYECGEEGEECCECMDMDCLARS